MKKADEFIRRAVGFALAAWFPLLVWNTYAALYVFYVLCALGLGLLVRGAWSSLPSALRHVSIAVVAVVAASLLTLLVTHGPSSSWRNFESLHAKWLGIIPLVVVFTRYRPAQGFFWWGALFGSIGVGIVALVEINQDIALNPLRQAMEGRINGGDHPVIFGMLSAALALLALAGYRYFARLGRVAMFAWIFGVGFGLWACLLTGTRGAWIAVFVASLPLFYFWWRSVDRRRKLAFLAAAAALPILLYQIPLVEQRFDFAYRDTVAYFERGPKEPVTGSLGPRFEMWSAAVRIFADHPWWGAGLGPNGYVAQLHALIAAGQVDPVIGQFKHPHNQFFSILASRGLVGVIAAAALLALLLMAYARALRQESEDARLALAGLMLIVAYMAFGATDVPLEHKNTLLLFIFASGVLMGMSASASDTGAISHRAITTASNTPVSNLQT